MAKALISVPIGIRGAFGLNEHVSDANLSTFLQNFGAAWKAGCDSIGLQRFSGPTQINWATVAVTQPTATGTQNWTVGDEYFVVDSGNAIPLYFRMEWRMSRWVDSGTTVNYNIGFRLHTGFDMISSGAFNVPGASHSILFQDNPGGSSATQAPTANVDFRICLQPGYFGYIGPTDGGRSMRGYFTVNRLLNADGSEPSAAKAAIALLADHCTTNGLVRGDRFIRRAPGTNSTTGAPGGPCALDPSRTTGAIGNDVMLAPLVCAIPDISAILYVKNMHGYYNNDFPANSEVTAPLMGGGTGTFFCLGQAGASTGVQRHQGVIDFVGYSGHGVYMVRYE